MILEEFAEDIQSILFWYRIPKHSVNYSVIKHYAATTAVMIRYFATQGSLRFVT